jgi:CubicO group peptidase (beta-lactamase class C family)
MYSCAKSVLSTLCGIALADGKLPPLDSSVLARLPAGGGETRDPRALRIDFEQLLTMTSGVAFLRARDRAVAEDQVAFALARPLAAEPGSRFIYTSAGPHLPPSSRPAGQSARDYAGQTSLPPGHQDWSRKQTGRGDHRQRT